MRRSILAVLLGSAACGVLTGSPIVAGADGSAGGSGGASSGTTSRASGATGTGGDGGSGSGTSDGAVACGCSDRGADDRCIRFVNACDRPIWPGASGDVVPADALAGVPMLAPGECTASTVQSVTGGRAFARTGCVGEVCASDGGGGRGTLVQFDLPAEGTDLYNVSVVDGFDLPIAMMPVGVAPDPAMGDACKPASCAADLAVVCPEGLEHVDDDGAIAWCESVCRGCTACPDCLDCAATAAPACEPCAAIAATCCTPAACGVDDHTAAWKSLCPDAITVAGEGPTFACDARADFDVVFCP